MSEHDVSAGDALRVIQEVSPESVGLVADLIEHNHGSTVWALEQAYEGEKAAHERTRQELAAAYERLDRIERRIRWLFGHE